MPRSRPLALPAAAALAALSLTALTLAACHKKDDVVVAAPVAPSAPAAGERSGPPTELPPGHPPMDGLQPPAPAPGMGGGMAAGDGGMPAAPAHGGAMSAGEDVGDVKVSKATGKDARTIAELFAQKGALAGKTVTVRGKVVKYNAGIMGKNWLHLRDGTGAAGKDNDVTVTTQDTVARGDVVTVQGKVAVDQDIGMGTPYPVIIQDAKVSR